MKIRYTIKLECDSKEDAMGLPAIYLQFQALLDSLITKGALPSGDVRYLLIPGKF